MKKKVRKNGLWVLLFLVIVLLCITAPLYAVYSPTEVDLGSVLQKPNAAHWFGFLLNFVFLAVHKPHQYLSLALF